MKIKKDIDMLEFLKALKKCSGNVFSKHQKVTALH